jgi:hypothetical protein
MEPGESLRDLGAHDRTDTQVYAHIEYETWVKSLPRFSKEEGHMRWYQESRVISGVIQIKDRGSELALINQDEGRFEIINTEHSRGIEKNCGEEICIEGRVKATASGRRYLWVNRWWQQNRYPVAKKIS